MFDSDLQKEIKGICLGLLARREYSQKELLDRLAVKGFERDESLCVVEGLAEKNWQSDNRFAESYTRYRIRKGVGPVKISHELWQRGIEGFDMEPVVLELAESWLELLQQVYEKKYTDEALISQKEWLKRSRFLQQRGFSSEMINGYLKTNNK